MQVLDYPEQLPEEAAAARQQLQELLRPNDSISQVCTCIWQLWQYIYLLGSSPDVARLELLASTQ